MAEIQVLDSKTIDLIAAGEVVERPSSVVKELVENALDAGATAITVEIKEGGISLIRVTDNGCGMEKSQVKNAFLRHSTSKIRQAEDLARIHSLGFRGEALSSIAAVSQVELITKTSDSLVGTRLCLEGGNIVSFDEIGAPDGTTFLMRNLFFNTPVRKKFLKQPSTEGGYVTDLMEHLAISRPDVSFRFLLGSQMRFHTSGNGSLKEVIYRIYGREIANALVPIQVEKDGIKVEGYLGKPTLVRSNRNYEIYFINGRFIRSSVVAKALEEGYKQYLMQHKFPLSVLHFSMDPEKVDVNVHPTKMDVRFWNNIVFADFLTEAVWSTLRSREMIPQDHLDEDEAAAQRAERKEREEFFRKNPTPEPFEEKRRVQSAVGEAIRYQTDAEAEGKSFHKSPVWERVRQTQEKVMQSPAAAVTEASQEEDDFFSETHEENVQPIALKPVALKPVAIKKDADTTEESLPSQLSLFDEKMLTQKNRDLFRIIGQVFDTYWMFEYQDKLCILDQHAAHEKIKYERLMKRFREKEILSQNLLPPLILSLSGQEESVLKEFWDSFVALGFELESFGGNEYCLRSVPVDLYGCSEKELFLSVLDELESGTGKHNPRVIEERIATMSCKAAVKGNTRLSQEEASALIDELLSLENPYNCPHGRPTIITISKNEMERKFKRIV